MTRRLDEPRSRRRLAAVAACGLLVAAAGGAGCNARRSAEGGAHNPKADAARKQLEVAATNAAKAAAVYAVHVSAEVPRDRMPATAPPPVAVNRTPAGPTVVAAERSAPRPAAPARPTATDPVIRETVRSEIPYQTEVDAERDALERAAGVIRDRLAALTPPVRFYPTPEQVKAEFVRKDSRAVVPLTPEQKAVFSEHRLSDEMVSVEFEVVVSAEQVRAVRTEDRVGFGLKLVVGLAVTALAGFLFLRADEWTKGYLTSWLAVAAVGLAGGVAAVLVAV